MATTKGPLFSMDASGSLAGSIVFSKWKGRNYVRRHAIPANPKSALQVGTRAMLRYLSQRWDSVSSIYQATWDAPAEPLQISPFNRFVGYNMDRWTLFKPPCQAYPAAEAGAAGTIANGAVTAEVLSILVEFEVTVLAQNMGVAIFRKVDSAPDESRGECVRVVAATAATTYSWVDIDVTVGVDYYYDVTGFSLDGVWGSEHQCGHAVAAA
jgi:hypothetical protein